MRNAVSLCVIAVLALAAVVSGCAKDVKQFEPTPMARVDSARLEPVQPRSVTELLRDAEKAFNEANVAQEKGDHEAALRQYTLMLELLIEADLDPGIFYSLRGELGKVLDTSTQHASIFEQRRTNRFATEDFGPLAGYSELQIPFPLPERVLIEIDEIQDGYPKNFQAGLDRSQKYIPYIREEFRKAGLPEELVWVAMVESMFTPKIVSRAGAGGMWQFMKSTGHRYNLRQDSHVDERYNWQNATRAAIAYLKDLNEMFGGDWGLAVTAYNMGEGGLERAIADNGGDRDLWRLLETPPASNRIPLETKKYYPRFLATLIVASAPERYGFKINPQPPENTVRMPVKGMYALRDLNRAMQLPDGTLEFLNPDLIQRVTPPTGEYSVAVPVEHRQTFLAALQKVKTVQYAGGSHTVRRGETIASISGKYRVKQDELMRINGIRSPRSLQVGQRLKLPGGAEAVSEVVASNEPAQAVGGAPSKSDAPEHARTYRVRAGDTLFDIARANRVSVSELQRWNQLGRNARIQVGRTLYITDPALSAAKIEDEPPAEATTPEAAPAKEEESIQTAEAGETQYHEVKAGEYPAQIARNYGITLDEFLKENGLSANSTIRVGDRLRVHGTASTGNGSAAQYTEETKEVAELTHVVAKGDTPGGIAAKYKVATADLLAWNKLTSRSVLHIGDKLVIRTSDAGPAKPAEPTRLASAKNAAAPQDEGERIVHVVARGHNPTTIARRYGVDVSQLYRWNSWPKNHVLRVGDQVVLYKH